MAAFCRRYVQLRFRERKYFNCQEKFIEMCMFLRDKYAPSGLNELIYMFMTNINKGHWGTANAKCWDDAKAILEGDPISM